MIPMRTPSSGGLTLFGVDSTLTCTINNLSEGFYFDFVFLLCNSGLGCLDDNISDVKMNVS